MTAADTTDSVAPVPAASMATGLGSIVHLPETDGSVSVYRMQGPGPWMNDGTRFEQRVAFAAAHVVAAPQADNPPGGSAAIDWDATLAHRHRLWALGFGVADAMDTAQRGMGLDWDATKELIRRSGAEAASVGGRLACGAGTDHKAPGELTTLTEVADAYCLQAETVSAAGAQVIVMASRHLAALARGPEDYAAVYASVFDNVDEPVILHWLGPMFDPALAGYWGHETVARATEHVLALIGEHRPKIDGIKVSLLDAEHEIGLRRALPDGVRLYTGDDFNYPQLIAGDAHGYSDALLGIFDVIAPAAAVALCALDQADRARYDEVMAPTEALSRHLFAPPTWFYKTGITFVSWLAGHQDAFVMVGGLQSGRSIVHLGQALRLADQAGLLPDPELAASRWRSLAAVYGVNS